MEQHKKEAIAKATALSGGVPSGRAGMYIPLHPTALADHLTKKSMPLHAFSDRATGIAYKPVMPNLQRKAGTDGTFAGTFSASGIDLDKKIPLEYSSSLPHGARGAYYPHGNLGRPLIDIVQPENVYQEINTAAHEYQHHNSRGAGAMAYIPSDLRGEQAMNTKNEYLTYRFTPEETLAFHAGDLAEENLLKEKSKKFGIAAKEQTVGDVAKRVNRSKVINKVLHKPDTVLLGHNKDYSQTDTRFERKKNMNLRDTIAAKEAGVKPLGDIAKKLSKKLGKAASVASIAGVLPQMSSMKRGYDNAKRMGASPLMGILSQTGILPMEERLQDGSIYNHSTGKVRYEKGREPI